MDRVDIPHHAIAKIRNSILPEAVSRLDTLELRVRMKSRKIVAVDLASFLEVDEMVYSEFGLEGSLEMLGVEYQRNETRCFRESGIP